jgi:hypothetical protein
LSYVQPRYGRHLRVFTVAVERAVPLLAGQDAVVGPRSTTQAVVLRECSLNIPGNPDPLFGVRVVIHQEVLGAPAAAAAKGVNSKRHATASERFKCCRLITHPHT